MFSLMSFFLVVNLAVMMQELTGSQPISAACASGANIRATPSLWGAPSSMCPEYNSCSPDESLSCPDCIHLVSHSPSTLILYLFISLATWTVFPVSYIVLMFHVASHVKCPGCQKGSQPCSFLSAFTALRHKSPRWRPFLAQVSTLVSCRWSFSNTSFLWVGLLALHQPLYPQGELFLP